MQAQTRPHTSENFQSTTRTVACGSRTQARAKPLGRGLTLCHGTDPGAPSQLLERPVGGRARRERGGKDPMSWPAWVLTDTSTPDKGKVRRCARGSAGLIAPGVGPPLIGPPWVGYRRPDDDEDGLPRAGGRCDDVVSRPCTNTGSGWKMLHGRGQLAHHIRGSESPAYLPPTPPMLASILSRTATSNYQS